MFEPFMKEYKQVDELFWAEYAALESTLPIKTPKPKGPVWQMTKDNYNSHKDLSFFLIHKSNTDSQKTRRKHKEIY
jgi:hypothetical protein